MDRDDRESDRERGLNWEVNDRKRKASSETEIRERERESRQYKDKNDGVAHNQDEEVEPEEADPEQNLAVIAHHQEEAVEDHTRGGRLLFVGNLDHRIGGDDLYELFRIHGSVNSARVAVDDNGNSLGYGFVEFDQLSEARAAQISNAQFSIGGRMMKVWAVTNQAWLMP